MSDIVVGYMQDGDLESLRRYIDQLGSINEYVYQDEENCLSLIHLAAGLDSPHRECVLELLIANRADLNCPGMSENVQHVRPLHLAAMWGYDLTVKLLLYHGADASLKDENDLSPVDYASIFDNYLCISLLLRYGSLNSTAAAWSAIMDSSLGDSKGGDSSLDESLINRTLEAAKISTTLRHHRKQKNHHHHNYYDLDREHDSPVKDCDSRNSKVEFQTFPMKLDRVSTPRKLVIEYDPFEHLDESEVRKNLELNNQQLRLELRRLGRNPGPITDTTKKLYAKLLTRLIVEDKELVYSPRTKTNSDLNGYSNELNSIITGKFSIKQALELEKEFLRLSGLRDHHGPKQFFNYILIDPRISRNIPEQANECASDTDASIISRDQDKSELNLSSDKNNNNISTKQSDKNGKRKSPRQLNRRFRPKFFTKFLESIFYIGKGQKRRDLMHLYDALADRNSITHKKIERIRGIWNDGYGVVSLHLFHNITSREALTREALMIETIGLENLTNLVKGSLPIKLAWNEHKRKQLGALLLHRAYNQLLNEGERQLRQDDLNIKT